MKKSNVLIIILAVVIVCFAAGAIIVGVVIPATTTYADPDTAIVGTWEDIEHYDAGDLGWYYTFNADGTGTVNFVTQGETNYKLDFKWKPYNTETYDSSQQQTTMYLCEWLDGSGGFVISFTSGAYMDTNKATHYDLISINDDNSVDYNLLSREVLTRVN